VCRQKSHQQQRQTGLLQNVFRSGTALVGYQAGKARELHAWMPTAEGGVCKQVDVCQGCGSDMAMGCLNSIRAKAAARPYQLVLVFLL
jgi:hypothetical protein